jgi:glucan phosphoethanolaminetransferase (alkaline phosphatase superfamily)
VGGYLCIFVGLVEAFVFDGIIDVHEENLSHFNLAAITIELIAV